MYSVLKSLRNILRKITFFKILFVKKEFEEQTSVSIKDFIVDLNNELNQKLNLSLTSELVFLGGFNNLFFIEHREKNQIKYISKIGVNHLLERENIFFEWQQVVESSAITPKKIDFRQINNSLLSCLTMSYMTVCKEIKPTSLLVLYKLLGQQSMFLSTLKNAEKNKFGYQFERFGDTKILMLLNEFVTQLHLPSSFQYIKSYLFERKNLFSDYPDVLIQINRLVCQVDHHRQINDVTLYYGLIHGDFKKGNFVQDDRGDLKVIDLQYYQYGARLWDLAFFCSKEKMDFTQIKEKIVLPLNISNFEKELFSLFYIVALLLHAKKNSIGSLTVQKILPALNLINLKSLP